MGRRDEQFKGRQFTAEVILWAVRWYLQFPISCRDLELMLQDRGVPVDHTTIFRWIQAYAAELDKRIRPHLRTSNGSWRVDETYVKIKGHWTYLYFGKGQGISAYTFVDERNLFWHSLVFSAAERESAYVIDGLMRNDVVKSDIHSTDTHGFSEVIFAVTHLVEVSFAPRIKNLKKQSLYMFRSRRGSDRTGWTIRPEQYVDQDSVIVAWDDVLRLGATIKLKESTASMRASLDSWLSASRSTDSLESAHRSHVNQNLDGPAVSTSTAKLLHCLCAPHSDLGSNLP